MREITLLVRGKVGLHARPAALFVQVASRFESTIQVRNLTCGGQAVDAKSILMVLTLGVLQNHEIGIQAEGPDAEEAISALQELVNADFGEGKITEKGINVQLRGVPASDGIAAGPAYCYIPPDLTVHDRERETTESELARFEAAKLTAKAELQGVCDRLVKAGHSKEAAVFEAQQTMLTDPALAEAVRREISKGVIVERAMEAAIEKMATLIGNVPDELLAARAADVRDVGRRLLRILLDLPDTGLSNVSTPSIVVTQDLMPSDTASLDPELTLGFCTAAGGLTSHTAILARTFGIPAVVALGDALLANVSMGDELIIDGADGLVIVRPDGETRDGYRRIKQRREERLTNARAGAMLPARTADGRLVEVAANVGDLVSAQDAAAYGAEGIGLLRTEFLYLRNTQPPNEEEQFQAYREILEVMGQRPVIIRTLDIGGDKPPSYMPFPQEMNPALGWRAIRVSLDRVDLFRTQLRAILRAATGHQVRIMFPMVNDVGELRRARQIVAAVESKLKSEGLSVPDDIPVGIMVETPAAAVSADMLCEEADFVSIGTNDLTQYTLAVDRGNAAVSGSYQPLHPAVLRLIKLTIDSAHAKGKWAGMCGELAGMPKAIPILLGFDLDEFSMNPRAIPEAKLLIGRISDQQAREVSAHVIGLRSATEVDTYMSGWLDGL